MTRVNPPDCTTHGMSYSKEYRVWWDMLTRCNNSNNKRFKDYGGRGIKVTKRWLKFENFYEDMGDRPSSEHSLDRIDNNGNYCKSNCRWATRYEQYRNRRANRYVKVGNNTLIFKDACVSIGLPYGRGDALVRQGFTHQEVIDNHISTI